MNNLLLGAMLGGWEILLILSILLTLVGIPVGIALLIIWLMNRKPSVPLETPPAQRGTDRPPPAPPAQRACPRCGAMLPPDSPQGLCPRCVLGVGLATHTEAPPEFGSHGTKVVEPPLAPADVAKHFPQLEILECLGQGGMGVVYKARQPKLNRYVALKILAPEKGADPRFAERFLREAQALARLSHPNIVTVHDFGESDGLFFLLMEYVDGMTLRQLMREGRMKPEEALAIVPRICEALQFAHDQGVVHRDIKPENVLLENQGRVKIADFGIAKLVTGDPERQTITRDQVVGTPHYMAPEQMETPQTVDHRADIYSLGVVFYEMLTGELPLGKFQSPSEKVQVDVRLDEVVLRALEREPGRRYQHASEVKTDLDTIAAGRAAASGSRKSGAPESVGPGPGEPPKTPLLRNPAKAPAAAILIVAIINYVLLIALTQIGGHGVPRSLFMMVTGCATALIVAGAVQMWRGKSYGLAVAAGFLVMVFPPACVLGVPLGLWTLFVLSRSEVRAIFNRDDSPGPLARGQSSGGSVALKALAVVVAGVMILLAFPVGTFLFYTGRRVYVTADPSRIVRVEAKLRGEVEKRLLEAGWQVEGLSVSVSPDLKWADCRFGTATKQGLTEVPFVASIRVEPRGENLWLVTGDGRFEFLRFSVDTSEENGAITVTNKVFQYLEPE